MLNRNSSVGTAAKQSSKCSLVQRPAIILAMLLLCAVFCQAQTKIGSITIADVVANKYFADCYLRPDTIEKRSNLDYGGCYNCVMRIEDADRYERQAKDFNENLERIAIGQIIVTVYYPAYKDTTYTDGLYLLTGMTDNSKRKIKEITDQPGGSYVNHTGKYLVPRKPSEVDFVKWFAVSGK